jgi:hypothetical protein
MAPTLYEIAEKNIKNIILPLEYSDRPKENLSSHMKKLCSAVYIYNRTNKVSLTQLTNLLEIYLEALNNQIKT